MAMRKEPSRRYVNAGALGEDIRKYLEGRPVAARGDTLMYRTSKLVSRHRKSFAVAGIGVVLGTALMLAWRDYVAPALRGTSAPAITIPLTSFTGDETQPAFSPDGARIAFVWGGENNDNSDIYVKSVRGVGLERITTNVAEDVSPTWSPDGKQVAWLRVSESETAVYIAKAEPNAVHGRVTSLFPNRIEAVGRHLDWSPDGKYLAAADRQGPDEPFRIVLIEIATGHKIQLTYPPEGTVGDSNPAFSADGKSVAFIRAVSSGVDDIFIRRIDSDEPAKAITTDKRYVISLGWSADGSYILFSSNRAGNHNLWKVPAAGGTPQRLVSVAQNASDPVFSRDGRLMAFSQFYMDSNIWHIDVGSGLTRKTVSSTQYDSSPSYSPDGSKIAFRSTRSGANEIWISNADGSAPYQLSTFGNSLTGRRAGGHLCHRHRRP
jgi:Tol biopolymer transport system component